MAWTRSDENHVHWAKRPGSDNDVCTAILTHTPEDTWVAQRHNELVKVFRGRGAEKRARNWVETVAKLEGLE